jgi:hypothetical protein
LTRFPANESHRRTGLHSSLSAKYRAGIFKSLWGLGTEEEEGYRTGPPGYIDWRNSFLGIDFGAPYTFKNTGSVFTSLHLKSPVHVAPPLNGAPYFIDTSFVLQPEY